MAAGSPFRNPEVLKLAAEKAKRLAELRAARRRTLSLERPLAVIDLETTGVWPDFDKIVEIAIIKLHPDGSRTKYHERLNPGMPIPEEATAVHGISDAD